MSHNTAYGTVTLYGRPFKSSYTAMQHKHQSKNYNSEGPEDPQI
jgi:hypothetical protein